MSWDVRARCAQIYGRRTKRSPSSGALKGISADSKGSFGIIFSEQHRVLHVGFLVFFLVPGRFRELREAFWNHFRLSWHLSDSLVQSYGRTPLGELLCSIYGMYICTCMGRYRPYLESAPPLDKVIPPRKQFVYIYGLQAHTHTHTSVYIYIYICTYTCDVYIITPQYMRMSLSLHITP